MKKLVSTLNLSHEEWLEYRKKGIGGSEIASILGVSPFSNAYKVWLDKTDKSEKGNFDNQAMYWGRRLEDIVAQEFTERTGLKVRRRNAILQHDDYDYLLANVDRMIEGVEEGLEVKTANEFSKTDWQDGNIPYHYYLQIQHYMLVTGYKYWWIAVLIGGNDFRYKRIERDEQIIELILEKCKEFWDYVLTDTPPIDVKWVDDLYSISTENTIQADVDDLIVKLDEKKSELKFLEKEIEQLEGQIKLTMTDNETLVSPSYIVTWKTTVTNRFDSKRFQSEQANFYNEYMVQSSYRKMTIKKKKVK
jgi:putative phage-type endonuclease